MASTDRRNFVHLLGLSGLGSVLLSQRALAASGSAQGLQGEVLPRPVPTDQNLAQHFLDLGIGQTNIAQVRDIIVNTIPSWDLDSMSNDLTGARAAYLAGAQNPPELASFEATFNLYRDSLVAQVQALGGSGALAEAVAAALAEPDQDPVDGWTLVHFASGFGLGFLGLDFGTTLSILILWEIIEPHIWPGWNESPENQVVDVIAGMLGWALAQLVF